VIAGGTEAMAKNTVEAAMTKRRERKRCARLPGNED